jgi:hypothetical protein
MTARFVTTRSSCLELQALPRHPLLFIRGLSRRAAPFWMQLRYWFVWSAPALPEVNQRVDSFAHRYLSSLASAFLLISPSRTSSPCLQSEARWDTVSDLVETIREARSGREFPIFALRWPSPLRLDQWHNEVCEPNRQSVDLSNPWGEVWGWIDGGPRCVVTDGQESNIGTQGPGAHCRHKMPALVVAAGHLHPGCGDLCRASYHGKFACDREDALKTHLRDYHPGDSMSHILFAIVDNMDKLKRVNKADVVAFGTRHVFWDVKTDDAFT